MSVNENESGHEEVLDQGRNSEIESFVARFKVKSTDMSEEMVENVMDALKEGVIRFEFHVSSGNTYSELAEFLKREMDKKYQPAWHCIVGEKFGTFMTHTKGNFIYMCKKSKSYGDPDVNIVLFKT